MYGPRGMTSAVRESIAADVRAVVAADPTIATRLAATGQVVDVRGPAEFAAGIKEIRDQLADIAKTLGIKPRSAVGPRQAQHERHAATSPPASPTTTCANGSRAPSCSARCATSRARAGRRTSGSPPRRSCARRTAPAWCSTRCRAARRASALLLNMFAGVRRNMTLGFPDHLTKWELSDAYPRGLSQGAEAHPARDRRGRPGLREHHHRRRHRRDQIPLAGLAREGRRPLHRHRHLQHHPRSGGELAQRRRLPRAWCTTRPRSAC